MQNDHQNGSRTQRRRRRVDLGLQLSVWNVNPLRLTTTTEDGVGLRPASARQQNPAQHDDGCGTKTHAP